MARKQSEGCLCIGLRDSLRLITEVSCVELHPAPLPPDIEHVILHRFHETIGGRAYQIEVTPVSNRWRAQLARTAGLPAAMMPFYGNTPAEAAQLLTKWLSLAHARVQVAPVAASSSADPA